MNRERRGGWASRERAYPSGWVGASRRGGERGDRRDPRHTEAPNQLRLNGRQSAKHPGRDRLRLSDGAQVRPRTTAFDPILLLQGRTAEGRAERNEGRVATDVPCSGGQDRSPPDAARRRMRSREVSETRRGSERRHDVRVPTAKTGSLLLEPCSIENKKYRERQERSRRRTEQQRSRAEESGCAATNHRLLFYSQRRSSGSVSSLTLEEGIHGQVPSAGGPRHCLRIIGSGTRPRRPT